MLVDAALFPQDTGQISSVVRQCCFLSVLQLCLNRHSEIFTMAQTLLCAVIRERLLLPACSAARLSRDFQLFPLADTGSAAQARPQRQLFPLLQSQGCVPQVGCPLQSHWALRSVAAQWLLI